jgi:hypothetical protein
MSKREIGMKAFHKKVRDRSGIPFEGNCPYLVVTDGWNVTSRIAGISRAH